MAARIHGASGWWRRGRSRSLSLLLSTGPAWASASRLRSEMGRGAAAAHQRRARRPDPRRRCSADAAHRRTRRTAGPAGRRARGLQRLHAAARLPRRRGHGHAGAGRPRHDHADLLGRPGLHDVDRLPGRHQPVPRRHRRRQRPEDQRLLRQRRVLPRTDLGRRRSDGVRPLRRHPDRRHVAVSRAAVRLRTTASPTASRTPRSGRGSPRCSSPTACRRISHTCTRSSSRRASTSPTPTAATPTRRGAASTARFSRRSRAGR